MKKLYQRFEAIFLTIVIVMGLADVVPVCKVEAAGTVLSSEEVADYFKGRGPQPHRRAGGLSLLYPLSQGGGAVPAGTAQVRPG